jgi:hypothetical protein
VRFIKRALQAAGILAAAGLFALTWARLDSDSGPTAAVSPEGLVTWSVVEERDIGRFVLFGVASERVTTFELEFTGQNVCCVHPNPDGAFQYIVPHHARVSGAVPFALLALGEDGELAERVDLGLR